MAKKRKQVPARTMKPNPYTQAVLPGIYDFSPSSDAGLSLENTTPTPASSDGTVFRLIERIKSL